MNAIAEGRTTTRAAAPVEPIMGSGMTLIDGLLRDRRGLLARIESGQGLMAVAKVMMLTITVSAAIYGICLGHYRGGVQMFFAGIKLPMVVLLTAGVCTPTFAALSRVMAGETNLRQDFALILSSLALGSLLILASAPVLLLAIAIKVPYHLLIELVAGSCAVGGLGGYVLFATGLKRRKVPGRFTIALILLGTFATVGSQMAWVLRPYLVRPRTVEVPFVRSIEGSFGSAVVRSLDSARGRYRRAEAPLPRAEVWMSEP